MTLATNDDISHTGAYLIVGESEIPSTIEVGRRYNLVKPLMIVSSEKDADVPIASKSLLRHCVALSLTEEGWLFENRGVPNTVRLNRLLSEERFLKDGDWLSVGNTTFHFLQGIGVLSNIYSQLFRMGRIDLHTGAYNKAQFWISLEDWINLSSRHHQPLSLLMIDIDHFKQVNTKHGHLGGDLVLKQVADRISQRLRKGDMFFRYGGEEFALILPETPKEKALLFAEGLRREIEQTPMEYEGHAIPITVSVGVAEYRKGMSKEQLVNMADQQTYQAKDTGRNRVCG